MTSEKSYFLNKQPAFQEIKVYVGGLKEELIRCVRYYMYVCYGKHWKESERFASIDFLIGSIELARNTHNNLARDIKKYKKLYQRALDDLLTLVNDSKPHLTDEHALRLIISFHRDMDRVINTVMRSKDTFTN